MAVGIYKIREPIKKVLIDLPPHHFNECENFAHEVYESNRDCYHKRGQGNKETVLNQIRTGKLAEWAIYYYCLYAVRGDVSSVDMEVYNSKSFDADLRHGNEGEVKTNIHVKSIHRNSANQFGLSWVIQKNDPMLKVKIGHVLALCQVINPRLVEFYGFLPVRIVKLGAMKKKSLESKYALYFDEQEHRNLLFSL